MKTRMENRLDECSCLVFLLLLLVRSLRDLRYSTEYTRYLANSSLMRRDPEGYVIMYLRRPSLATCLATYPGPV